MLYSIYNGTLFLPINRWLSSNKKILFFFRSLHKSAKTFFLNSQKFYWKEIIHLTHGPGLPVCKCTVQLAVAGKKSARYFRWIGIYNELRVLNFSEGINKGFFYISSSIINRNWSLKVVFLFHNFISLPVQDKIGVFFLTMFNSIVVYNGYSIKPHLLT